MQESIGKVAEAEQVIRRADQREALRSAGRSFEVSPIGGNQRLASIR